MTKANTWESLDATAYLLGCHPPVELADGRIYWRPLGDVPGCTGTADEVYAHVVASYPGEVEQPQPQKPAPLAATGLPPGTDETEEALRAVIDQHLAVIEDLRSCTASDPAPPLPATGLTYNSRLDSCLLVTIVKRHSSRPGCLVVREIEDLGGSLRDLLDLEDLGATRIGCTYDGDPIVEGEGVEKLKAIIEARQAAFAAERKARKISAANEVDADLGLAAGPWRTDEGELAEWC